MRDLPLAQLPFTRADGLSLEKVIVDTILMFKKPDSTTIIVAAKEQAPKDVDAQLKQLQETLLKAFDRSNHQLQLLVMFAHELAIGNVELLGPLIREIFVRLKSCGFDFNRRRRGDGTTLLVKYAGSCHQTTGPNLEIVQELLKHGACASVADATSNTWLFKFVENDVHFPYVLLSRESWKHIGDQLEPWQRNANGESLVQVMLSKGDEWKDDAYTVQTLIRLWQESHRPLLLRCISAFSPLILDLAHIVLSYIDGEERLSEKSASS
jgi:hypothetical protein